MAETELIHAIERGDVDTVLVELAGAPQPLTEDGQTVVTLAARFDQPGLLRGFLARGFPVDSATSGGMTALMFAAARGSHACVHALLHGGARASLKDAEAVARKNGHDQLADVIAKWSVPEGTPCCKHTPVSDALALFQSIARGPAARRARETEATQFAALLDASTRAEIGKALLHGTTRDYGRALLEDASRELAQAGRDAEALDAYLGRAEAAADAEEAGVAFEAAWVLARRIGAPLLTLAPRLAENLRARGRPVAALAVLDEQRWRAPSLAAAAHFARALADLGDREGAMRVARAAVVGAKPGDALFVARLLGDLARPPAQAASRGPRDETVIPRSPAEELPIDEVDLVRRAALAQRLATDGRIVPLDAFFGGNNDRSSFAPNLPGDLSPQLLLRWFLGIAALDEVDAIHVPVDGIAVKWLYADALYVVTRAPLADARRWLPAELAPDEISVVEGIAVAVPPGHHVLRLWWD